MIVIAFLSYYITLAGRLSGQSQQQQVVDTSTLIGCLYFNRKVASGGGNKLPQRQKKALHIK